MYWAMPPCYGSPLPDTPDYSREIPAFAFPREKKLLKVWSEHEELELRDHEMLRATPWSLPALWTERKRGKLQQYAAVCDKLPFEILAHLPGCKQQNKIFPAPLGGVGGLSLEGLLCCQWRTLLFLFTSVNERWSTSQRTLSWMQSGWLPACVFSTVSGYSVC